ncbi:hypothetical protein WOLCODRAFT_157291 [Wolfiporia cocos MD-104 SS10]|uniref:Uncharacterized protein n=1 Tax=Wolfiporia cocos (strain MD-104) TaxID=742152 RepID=A0A2H3J345_WOLCO|nr:hypothetical protein WOLCODRAFT_157291 [Wolfiporia cocos MD-104 SS10]
MALMQQLIRYLKEEPYELAAPDASDLAWGAETERLTASAVVLTGIFDHVLTAGQRGVPSVVTSGEFGPFLPLPLHDPQRNGTITTRFINLNTIQTQKLQALCKVHGRTVADVINVVMAVAHIEANLFNAQYRGFELWKQVHDLYDASTEWLIPFSFKDQVGHTSINSPASTPLFAVDGNPIIIDMSQVRRALAFDHATGDVSTF